MMVTTLRPQRGRAFSLLFDELAGFSLCICHELASSGGHHRLVTSHTVRIQLLTR